MTGFEHPIAPTQGRDARECYRESLYRRLENGYRKVEQGLAEGCDMTTWEAFWIDLLREYERVCDDLDKDKDKDLAA